MIFQEFPELNIDNDIIYVSFENWRNLDAPNILNIPKSCDDLPIKKNTLLLDIVSIYEPLMKIHYIIKEWFWSSLKTKNWRFIFVFDF